MTFTSIGSCVPVRAKPNEIGQRMQVLAFNLASGEFVARLADSPDVRLHICRGATDERGAWYQTVREISRDDLTFLLTLPDKPAL